MKKLVIIPGGFHPFHAGHKALFDAARAAWPSAEIYIAATADTSNRPFPFGVKQKLAHVAGIPLHRFIQVKSPFRATEITQHFDPKDTILIFARSDKDKDQGPQAGGIKKDGTPAYIQPYKRNMLEPMSQHAYMAYLPTVQFGPGMTSATEIRAKWPEMTAEQKTRLVNGLYPATQDNAKLTDVTVRMLDHVLGTQAQTVKENEVEEAWLKNDPDAGHLIVPDGGMGTWNEETLASNLDRKFQSMQEMLQNKNYDGLEYVLYQGGVVENMVKALAQYSKFMDKQGRRPIAQGREIDLSQVNENPDYIDEGEVVPFPGHTPPENLDQARELANKMIAVIKDETNKDPSLEIATLRGDLKALGFRVRLTNKGFELVHSSGWTAVIDTMRQPTAETVESFINRIKKI
jgi:hypothetical protein